MVEKLNWLVWLILVILWNFGFPEATPLQDVIVAVILSLLFIIYLKKNFLSIFIFLEKTSSIIS